MSSLNFKIFILFLFAALPLFGQQPQSSQESKAYDILSSAIKTTLNATFKSEKNDRVRNIARKRVLYHRNEKEFNLLRRETFFDGKLATIEISNTSGDYTIFVPASNYSIKKDMPKSQYNLEISEHFITAIKTLQNNNYGCQYSLTEDTFNGIPVYTIKITSPTNIKDLAKMMGVTEQEAMENEKTYWKYRIVRVNKKDNFIYTIDFYISSGNKSHSYDWGTLEFTSSIPLELFSSPKDPVVVKNKEDLVEKVENKLKATR